MVLIMSGAGGPSLITVLCQNLQGDFKLTSTFSFTCRVHVSVVGERVSEKQRVVPADT